MSSKHSFLNQIFNSLPEHVPIIISALYKPHLYKTSTYFIIEERRPNLRTRYKSHQLQNVTISYTLGGTSNHPSQIFTLSDQFILAILYCLLNSRCPSVNTLAHEMGKLEIVNVRNPLISIVNILSHSCEVGCDMISKAQNIRSSSLSGECVCWFALRRSLTWLGSKYC